MKLGRFTLFDVIGQGTMATVYRAHDPLIDRPLAIKTIPLARLRAEGHDALARFTREAQNAGRLTHPGIVTIYDVGECDDTAYIAMELLVGPSLRALQDTQRPALTDTLRIARQLAEALEYAHSQGVIHRDIKPGNVLLAGHNRVKLTDFGIAQVASVAQSGSDAMQASPRYMSPEQVLGRPLDARTDVFSLGALIYEMLTGRFAFDADTLPGVLRCVLETTPPSPELARDDLPAGLAAMTLRMLEKSPENRPTLAEVLDTLALCSEPPAVRRAPRPASAALPWLALTGVVGLGVALSLLSGLRAPQEITPVAAVPVESASPALPPLLLADPGRSPLPADVPATGGVFGTVPRPVFPTPPANAATARAARPPASTAAPDPVSVQRQELEKKRRELLLFYTTDHPDVRLVDRQLEQLGHTPTP